MSDANSGFDPKAIQKQIRIEEQVSRELPKVREAEIFVRELFFALLARSGDPANRQIVETAWKNALNALEFYLNRADSVSALHRLHLQRKIRARMLLS